MAVRILGRELAGLREAMKVGPLDLRAALFGEAARTSAYLPLRASRAALYSSVGVSTRGAFGAELIVDSARASPYVLAPECQILGDVLGRPLRFEVAVPFTLGARAEDAALGLAVRLVFEPEE